MKIALAFSGGGVRATVFHLGVLARLARQNLLGDVETISSVSGGSLAAGLVFASNGNAWPTSAQYLHHTVPQIHSLLTSCDLQWNYAVNSLLRPWRLLSGRAAILGDAIERLWCIDGRLADLPIAPRWIINATCYETGKNWRFQRDLMGDYQTKYITDPDFPLSAALAASAAVPCLVGPLKLKSHKYQWSEYRDNDWQAIPPKYRRLHLWDGGVYDNLGVESLFKPGEGLRGDADFLIVSDASRPLSDDVDAGSLAPGFVKASMRLVDVATDQVRSLRARMLIDYFRQNPGSGAYLRMGRTTKQSDAYQLAPLTSDQVRQAAMFETTLRRLTHSEFSLLFRHGYEIANATLSSYSTEELQRQPKNQVQFRAA